MHYRLEGKLDEAELEKKKWMHYVYVTALAPNVGHRLRSGGSLSWKDGRLLGAVAGRIDIMGGCPNTKVQAFLRERGVVIVTIVVVEITADALAGTCIGETVEIVACEILRASDFKVADAGTRQK